MRGFKVPMNITAVRLMHIFRQRGIYNMKISAKIIHSLQTAEQPDGKTGLTTHWDV